MIILIKWELFLLLWNFFSSTFNFWTVLKDYNLNANCDIPSLRIMLRYKISWVSCIYFNSFELNSFPYILVFLPSAILYLACLIYVLPCFHEPQPAPAGAAPSQIITISQFRLLIQRGLQSTRCLTSGRVLGSMRHAYELRSRTLATGISDIKHIVSDCKLLSAKVQRRLLRKRTIITQDCGYGRSVR